MASAPLVLFNSLGRELQEFQPVSPGQARLYTCGLTVYNYAHLGNLRAYLFTDTLRRILQWKGYDVLHIMNITDVGHLTSDADEGADKMEQAAQRKGKSVWEIAEYYTRDFQRNLERLNVLPPSAWTRATDHIQEMIEFARVCDERGYTYVLDDGLYFDTSKVKDYGKLGLLELEGQREGARVQKKGDRKHPSDFAVWRFSPKDKQRLMEWHSPWGVGAPGWHLECSVMSLKYLGRRFDIHTGGIDHRQIHHVNEIAQNQAYLGNHEVGANLWMHNEFLVVDEAKMSKSQGDFLRLETIVDWGIHPLVYRYFALQAHYRSQLEFSLEALVAARSGLRRLLRQIEALRAPHATAPGSLGWLPLVREATASRGGSLRTLRDQLAAPLPPAGHAWVEKLDGALSRDLNTAQALSILGEMFDDRALSGDEMLRLVAIFDLALGLELLTLPASELHLRPRSATLEATDVDRMLAERQAARKARDFKRADAIRDEIVAAGVLLKDTPEGTVWEWIPRP